MKQGDKFIVIDNSTNQYEKGEVVIYHSVYGYGWHYFTNKEGIKQCLCMDDYEQQVKPLEQPHADDEQPNN
jgi:hypothetical protein